MGLQGRESFRVWGVAIGLCAALMARAQSSLPDGPGRMVVERMCTSCHGVEQFTGLRMTKQHWSATVADMLTRGAQGSDSDVDQVVSYLTEHFGTVGGDRCSSHA